MSLFFPSVCVWQRNELTTSQRGDPPTRLGCLRFYRNLREITFRLTNVIPESIIFVSRGITVLVNKHWKENTLHGYCMQIGDEEEVLWYCESFRSTSRAIFSLAQQFFNAYLVIKTVSIKDALSERFFVQVELANVWMVWVGHETCLVTTKVTLKSGL